MAMDEALSGDCTTVAPPAACTARKPRAPSLFAPDRSTAMSRGPYSSAADSNNTSIDGREKFSGASTDRDSLGPESTSK